MRFSARLLACLSLAGCAQLAQGPSLAGYPGLQWQVESFYGARALEENAMCTQPRMTAIVGHEIVEDTPERMVMNVRYHYVDEGMRNFDDEDGLGFPRFRFGTGSCDDFATRTFIIAKGKGGAPDAAQAMFVQSMNGPQRELAPNSALR
jgi:hypothetical protein